MSQEMSILRAFLAFSMSGDNQMTLLSMDNYYKNIYSGRQGHYMN